ncbi:MAG: hypothetical protein JWP97_285 [Labilithrix sp.]|nr:hypothetical protein [Labilithrix sp.]
MAVARRPANRHNGPTMRLRASYLAGSCLLGGFLAITACTTDYQKGEGDVAYGGPNALSGKEPPDVTQEVTADGGGASSSGGAGAPACVAKGGTLVDAGAPCAVSFSKDILAAFGVANCNNTACHGGASPRNKPAIEPSDGPTTWAKFQSFTMSTAIPYINPCSTDPLASAMGQNLLANTGAKGGVHMPQGGQLEQADIDKVNTWLTCGSPNN